MYYHFTAIGICPMSLLDREQNDECGMVCKQRRTQVPVALEPGSFSVATSINEDGEKVIKVTNKVLLTHPGNKKNKKWGALFILPEKNKKTCDINTRQTGFSPSNRLGIVIGCSRNDMFG